jgi:hypothetical protein
MSNTYGLSKEDENEIRARDRNCVYCHVSMKQFPYALEACGATIEHFNNDGPLDKPYNAAMCCRRCNSSKGTKTLLIWFKTPYCIDRAINTSTVAAPVRTYLRHFVFQTRDAEVDQGGEAGAA